MICALILWKSDEQFHKFLIELSAHHMIVARYHRVTFSFSFCDLSSLGSSTSDITLPYPAIRGESGPYAP